MGFFKTGATVLVLLAIADCAKSGPAAAQSATKNERQSLDDAWWTGPMLANSARTLPQGHKLIESYLFDDIQGNSSAYRSFNYLLYGVTDRFTLGLIPVGGVNRAKGTRAAAGLNDITLQLQYGLTQFDGTDGVPDISLALRQTFPNGKYDRLTSPIQGFGGGAYATGAALFVQNYFWLPNGRLLRARFDLYETVSGRAPVRDTSVYGTGLGFLGHADPGAVFVADVSLEYSLSRSWVMALEAVYNHGDDTRIHGTQGGQAVAYHLGSSDGFGLAPAVEFSWAPNLGVLLGTRILMAGRNTPFSVTPAIAINYVD
jgi:hypothetical protein